MCKFVRCDLGINECSPGLGISAARDGCGAFLADRIEVDADLRSGSLVVLGEPTLEAQYSHYLVTDQDDVASVRARLFGEYLGRELASL